MEKDKTDRQEEETQRTAQTSENLKVAIAMQTMLGTINAQ